MDDIIISANDIKSLQIIMNEIIEVANRSGFVFNKEKTMAPSKNITAFNIDLSKGAIEVREDRLNKFCKVYTESDSYDQCQGILYYVSSFNKVQADEII